MFPLCGFFNLTRINDWQWICTVNGHWDRVKEKPLQPRYT